MSPEWNLQSKTVSLDGKEDAKEGDVLEELPSGVEHDHRNVRRTEDPQLVRLLEETVLALEKRDLTVALVLNRSDGDLATTHVQEEGREGM
jgi:hypothetical protein